MNLQQRLALIGKSLPTKPADANPFTGMTDDELKQIGVELGELVQSDIDKDPNAVDTINPRLVSYLKSEGLI
jgi:hypothetical protein